MDERKSIWESALIPGLVLGAIPAVCILFSGFLDGWKPQGTGMVMVKTLASMLIWAAKVAGCFVVFRIFMARFVEQAQPQGNVTFRFGLAMALLSALIFSGFHLAYITYICPDTIEQAVGVFKQELFPKLDAATRSAFEGTIPKLPRMMFIANLVYCFCYGTVLSAILSAKFKK